MCEIENKYIYLLLLNDLLSTGRTYLNPYIAPSKKIPTTHRCYSSHYFIAISPRFSGIFNAIFNTRP